MPRAERPAEVLDAVALQQRARDILAEAVRQATGNRAAQPRQQQLALLDEIVNAVREGRRYAAQAPTGSGKSFAYLCAVAATGARAVVVTETKSLQSQLVGKDLPAVAKATEVVTNGERSVSFAVQKGRSNYLCKHAALQWADFFTEKALDNMDIASVLRESSQSPLAQWLAAKLADTNWDGDLEDIPPGYGVSPTELHSVSVSSEECLGNRCPFRTEASCFADDALARAENAQVVVANHALLAIEMMTKAPIVLQRGEPFDVLVIDEAHALEGVVRSRESSVFAPARVNRVVRQFANVVKTNDTGLLQQIAQVAADTGDAIRSLVAEVGADENDYHKVNALVMRRVSPRAQQMLKLITKLQRTAPRGSSDIAVVKAARRLAGVVGDIDAVASLSTESNVAASVAGDDEREPSVTVQSIALSSNIWSALSGTLAREDDPLHRTAVVALSATLPLPVAKSLLGYDLGENYSEFRSPFVEAYDRSLLYVPNGDQGVVPDGRFKHTLHPEWAIEHVVPLILANEGRALILATSAREAEWYRQQLQKRLPSSIPVFFYRDGGSAKSVIQKWKEDEHSVLVATRGMMTGVDAPGETCSLVVITRVPRDAKTVVNELRVEYLLASNRASNRYLAEAMVYGADAAVLLEQAVGRLIRHESDRGVVAVLDPRLEPRRRWSYRGPYMQMYTDALSAFAHRTGSLEECVRFVEGMRGAKSHSR